MPQPKRKPRSKEKKRRESPAAKAKKEGKPTLLGQALSHPMRVSILMKMNTPKRIMSPSSYAEETGELLSNCAYHFRQLREYELIRLVKTAQRRGATEHFYEPVKRAMAWTQTYGTMPDAVKQNLASTALNGAVLSIGNSVDAGTFDARPDAHLSYDQMLLDPDGWKKMTGILNDTLLKQIEVRDEVLERLEADPDLPDTFIGSYLMSCWEAAPLDYSPRPLSPPEPMKLPRLDELGCFPRPELVRVLDAALEGLRVNPPDSFTSDYLDMRGEVERLLREAGAEPSPR